MAAAADVPVVSRYTADSHNSPRSVSSKMAHLITHHDPFHIHKILGVLVLLHYIYRFYLVFQTGTAFPASESPLRAICGVILHGLLSWSSLLLPLPTRRNFAKPMIWPEFRLHSILFASRHVFSAILSLAHLWPKSNVGNLFARASIILGTVNLASIITQNYGCHVKRTTNSMPYPENVTPEQQLAIRRLYTTAQFGATVTCFMNDASMNFAPLLGIQMAPLLMTLVRKGKISTGMYHRVYATSLSLGYLMIFARLGMLFQKDGSDFDEDISLDTVAYTYRALVLFSLPFSRSRNYISAKTFWTGATLLATVVYPTMIVDGKTTMSINDESLAMATYVVRKIIALFFVVTMTKHVCTYAPLFGNPTIPAAAKNNAPTKESPIKLGNMGALDSLIDMIWRFLRNDFGTAAR